MAFFLGVGSEPIPGYRVTRSLGYGTFGQVWEVTSPGGTKSALKCIALSGREGKAEFKAMRLVKQIHHPHLVPIYGLWLRDQGGRLLDEDHLQRLDQNLSIELARLSDADMFSAKPAEMLVVMGLGEKTLLERLHECKKEGLPGIPPEELLEYLQDAAKGLDYLNRPIHDLGQGPVSITHGDIKPQTILLLGGSAQICDFGLASAMLEEDKRRSIMGAPTYAAPEVLSQRGPCLGTDQYSLAITYYELRTGQLPIRDSESLLEVIQAHLRGGLDFSCLNAQEQQVLKRATAPEPAQRFETVAKFIRALRQSATDEYFGTPSSGTPKVAAPGPVANGAMVSPAVPVSAPPVSSASPAVRPGSPPPYPPTGVPVGASAPARAKAEAPAVPAARPVANPQPASRAIAQPAAGPAAANPVAAAAPVAGRSAPSAAPGSSPKLDAASPSPALPHLNIECVHGPNKGAKFLFEGHRILVVGRGDRAQVRLSEDRHLSRCHFFLEFSPPHCYMQDLRSRNGTLVNGVKQPEAFVESGQIVSAGQTHLRVHLATGYGKPDLSTHIVDLSTVESTNTTRMTLDAPRVVGYNVTRLIGGGGLARLFLARQISTQKEVVLKVYQPGRQLLKEAVGQFVTAAQRVVGLEHPRITTVREAGEANGVPYLVYDFVPVVSVKQSLQGRPADFQTRLYCALVCQMLEGLDYLHRQGIIHRDLHPGNVLCYRKEKTLACRLADFGVSKMAADAGLGEWFRLKVARNLLAYVAPEQVLLGDANPQSDLYSIAAIMFEHFAGRCHFNFTTEKHPLLTMLDDDPVRLATVCPQLNPKLCTLIDRALSREPGDRFASAAEMRAAVLPFVQG